MEITNSNTGIVSFQDPNRDSAHILANWLERSGVKSRTVLEELIELAETEDAVNTISMKSFSQWTSDVASGKLIGALTPETRGVRVVAIVRWFINEHGHRRQPVIYLQELERFIHLYSDLPVKFRLQLQRILHEFQINDGLVKPEALFERVDWQHQYARWNVFGFVIDHLWCLRASNILDLELVGLRREDTQNWGWWHRLAVPVKGITKYSNISPINSLRGPYAETYYRFQMKRFSLILDNYLTMKDQRCLALYELLMQTEGFEAMLEQSRVMDDVEVSNQLGVPIPFFRSDGTLLWMYELSVAIPGDQGLQLVIWSPVDNDSSEYLADLRRQAMAKSSEAERTLFIEDFAHNFSDKERLALGVS